MLATLRVPILPWRELPPRFPLRNVFGERHQESRPSLRVRQDGDVVAYPNWLTILTAVPLFDLKLLALSVEQFADQRPIMFDILFVGDVKESELP